nr:MAG TPA: Invasin ipaB, type three secretion system.05A [Caudoviricetes sp.]
MIKVRSKTLFIPAEEQSIGAVGEAESTIREFHIDRISGDGVDLANLIFRLNLRYAGVQRTDRSDLEKVVTDSTIILRWTISAVTLKNPGTIFVQLDAFDDGGACRWKSYQGAMYVEKSVGTPTATPQELSELEQLERKLEKLKVASESLESIEQTDKKFTAAMEEVKANKEFVAQAKDSVDEAKRAVDTAKQAVDTAKQAVDTAKAEYEAAKQDIIDKRLEVNALYGDVFKAKTSVSKLADDVRSEVRIAESEKTEISNKIAEVGRAIIGTQAFSESAKTAAQNASASADRASASETKVTEALKKAEKMASGGTVSGVTETEMHQYVSGEIGKVRTGVPEETMRSYVAGEIGKVKTGISADQATQIANNCIMIETITADSRLTGALKGLITNEGTVTVNSGEGSVVGVEAMATILSQLRGELKKTGGTGGGLTEEQEKLLKLVELEKQPERNIAELLGYPSDSSGQAVVAGLQINMRKGVYGHIRPGDYFYYDWEQKNRKLKFKVLGVNPYNIGKPHIDFICLDARNTSTFMDMEKLRTFTAGGRYKPTGIIYEWSKEFISDNAGLLRLITKKNILNAGNMQIWAPTKCEVFGKDFYADKIEPFNKEYFQYPLFAKSQEERLCRTGDGKAIGFVLLDNGGSNNQAVATADGSAGVIEFYNAYTTEQKKGDYCIPICFRVVLPG